MGRLDVRFHVDATAERVRGACARPESVPAWQQDVVRVEEMSGPLDQVGTTCSRVYPIAGRLRRDWHEVTRVEPGRPIQQSRSTPLGGWYVATTILEPSRGGADVTWRTYHRTPGRLLGQLADGLVIQPKLAGYVTVSNERFRALVEQGVRAST